MGQLSEEYLNSVCEIKSIENQLLCTGVIERITPEYIEIASRTGSMPILRYRTEVKLSIFNHKLGFQVLTGIIYISNRKMVRIADTTNIVEYERRNFFRVDTRIPAEAILLKKKDENDEPLRIKVVVRNLSLGGVLLDTSHPFEPEEVFHLSLPLNSTLHVFTCRVHRMESKSEEKRLCGCEFLDYADSQGDALCSYLFQCQREYLKKI